MPLWSYILHHQYIDRPRGHSPDQYPTTTSIPPSVRLKRLSQALFPGKAWEGLLTTFPPGHGLMSRPAWIVWIELMIRKANPQCCGDPEEWPLTLPSWERQKEQLLGLDCWQSSILGEVGVEWGAKSRRFYLRPKRQLVWEKTRCFTRWTVAGRGQGMKYEL